MEIRSLEITDIHPYMLDCFNRYQEVTKCYRRNYDNWVIQDALYIRDWDEEKKKWMTSCFYKFIEQGDQIIGAFIDNKLIGFAKIDKKLYGRSCQYINLSYLLISNEYRQKGIGKKLFKAACEKAVNLNGKKLYISAHSSMDSIKFYLKMGCKDALEIINEVVDEPNDLQMEYDLC